MAELKVCINEAAISEQLRHSKPQQSHDRAMTYTSVRWVKVFIIKIHRLLSKEIDNGDIFISSGGWNFYCAQHVRKAI